MNWEDRIGRRLTLRDLRILMTTVEIGSMSKAAAALRMSQPAISKTIGQMEAAVGARLLDRSSRGISLTEQGRALLTRSQAAFRELREGIQALENISYPSSGTLRLAGNQVSLASLLPTVISRLYARYPGVRFHVAPAYTYEDQIRVLEKESVDLVFGRIAPPTVVDHLRIVELFNDEFVVAAGLETRWAARKNLTLAKLMDEPWAFPALTTITGRQVVQIFDASGLQLPKNVVIASSIQLHLRLVLESGFLTLLPKSIAFSVPGLQVLPVALEAEERSIGIMTLKHRSLSPLAKLCIDEALKCVKERRLHHGANLVQQNP